jgi:hypothetical protein
MIVDVYTDALRKAGTVDDIDKIIEVLETEPLDTMLVHCDLEARR